MPTIQDQIAWEESMATRGVERFRNQQEKASEGRAHETSAGSRLLKSYVITISKRIRLYLDKQHPDGRRRNKFAKFLDTLDTDKVSMIALRAVISAVFNDGVSVASLCNKIGRQCEDELRLTKFQIEYKEYYDSLIRDMERKNVANYKHKRRVLIGKGKDQGLVWQDWSEADAIGVGALVISLLMEVCNLVEKVDGKKIGSRTEPTMIRPTTACLDWIAKHDSIVELTSPDRMPCIIPPANWVSVTDGGFWSPGLRNRTPLIKSKQMTEERKIMYAEAEMPQVLSAVNVMQRTAWEINEKVYSVMQEVWSKNLGCGMPRSEPFEFPDCPLSEGQVAKELEEGSKELELFNEWKASTRELHTMEKERVAKNLALIRTMRIAREMREYDKFWYVYQCDFRGRVYAASAGLTPQGTDQSKALIRFAEPVPLTNEAGLRWFLINGANKYGYDKVSYDERIAWTRENAADFINAAEDPITFRGIWASADKPYQFLAWLFEFRDMQELEDPYSFFSHLPVGVDGSCNGLQHFSAMLADKVGGAAVNLLPGEQPSDIYQDVADLCWSKLKDRAEAGDAAALNWVQAIGREGMPRGLPKVPVMTLPYGSTQQACTSSIYAFIHGKLPDGFDKNTKFRHAIYLSPILWESISEVVIAARSAMDWIQECASTLSKKNVPLRYYSPLGFPVLQATAKFESRQIETQISGRLRIRVAKYTDKLDTRKQRQGSSPNLVHHVDACHMMMTINACEEDGVNTFAMIHDDFGTHARDVDKLQKHIREQFVCLHGSYDILSDFKKEHEERYGVELPELPACGSLDVEEVIQSEYFFG